MLLIFLNTHNFFLIKSFMLGTQTCVFQSRFDAILQGSYTLQTKIDINLESVGLE